MAVVVVIAPARVVVTVLPPAVVATLPVHSQSPAVSETEVTLAGVAVNSAVPGVLTLLEMYSPTLPAVAAVLVAMPGICPGLTAHVPEVVIVPPVNPVPQTTCVTVPVPAVALQPNEWVDVEYVSAPVQLFIATADAVVLPK